jgi:hypothetical protein
MTRDRAAAIVAQHRAAFGSDVSKFMTATEDHDLRRIWMHWPENLTFSDVVHRIAAGRITEADLGKVSFVSPDPSALARRLLREARALIADGVAQRDAVVQTIDNFYGYTAERARLPEAHRADYDRLQERL